MASSITKNALSVLCVRTHRTHRTETQDYDGGGHCTNVRTDSTQPSRLGWTAPNPLVKGAPHDTTLLYNALDLSISLSNV